MGGFISAADEERLTITPPFFSRNLGSRTFVIYKRVGDHEGCEYGREWKKRDRGRIERETQKERGRERKREDEGTGRGGEREPENTPRL
jgi:hypothetical protein